MTSSPGIPSLSQAFATAFNSLLFNSHGMVINSGPFPLMCALLPGSMHKQRHPEQMEALVFSSFNQETSSKVRARTPVKPAFSRFFLFLEKNFMAWVR